MKDREGRKGTKIKERNKIIERKKLVNPIEGHLLSLTEYVLALC
jgi:hypothetical protein